MASSVSSVTDIASSRALDPARMRAHRLRILLGFTTVSAVAAAVALGPGGAAGSVDPDLARLLRYMALLKGVFALAALGISYWRLARPAAAWREAVYVGGPGLMAGGAICLWQMQSAGLAAAGLHLGLFALLAAALSDPSFIPGLRRRAG